MIDLMPEVVKSDPAEILTGGLATSMTFNAPKDVIRNIALNLVHEKLTNPNRKKKCRKLKK